MSPSPFVRWPGGKWPMLAKLAPYFAAITGAYHEPCAGSGAVFFALFGASLIRAAHLGDANASLVNLYLVIRDNLAEFLGWLAEHAVRHSEAEAARLAGKPTSEHYYYRARAAFNEAKMTPVEQAATALYLNKTCFNGLWRVSSRTGHFNTPLGDVKNPRILDEVNLRACSTALQGVEIRCEDFSAVLGRAQPGDLVYLDPPYVPASETAKFANYTAAGFGAADHARMAEVAATLKARGVHVVVSNSDTPLVRQLYATGFELIPVMAPRAMAARASSRGPVQELVIR